MIPINQLFKEHSDLIGKMRRFSFSDAARLVATLSLRPEFHANTVRIEALQHLVAISCHGTAKPNRDDLSTWIKLLNESQLAPMEDPVEDVFVGYINSAWGGFRVLRGIFLEGDYWTERLLVFLEEKQDFPPFKNAVESALPILRLSEALMDRVGLFRYRAGSGKSAEKMQVPQWRKLEPCFQAIYFSDSELAAINIHRDELREFVLSDEERAKLNEQMLWNTSLERHPLLAVSGGIIVIAPSNLLRATARCLLEQIASSGIGGFGDMFFQNEAASVFVNEIARRLEIEPLDFERPEWPDGLPSMMPFFGFFDFGKPVIMLTHCIPISKSASDFNGYEQFTKEQELSFDNYLQSCTRKLEQMPGFSGGLILICLASVGFSTSFSTSRSNSNWHFHTATLPDWLIITGTRDCTAMRLWKLGQHEEVLHSRHTRTINLSGLLNLYAYWKSNGFRLIPRDKDGRVLGILHINCDFATAERVETKNQIDLHCVRSHDGQRWVKLSRRNTNPLFEEDAHSKWYIDQESATHGHLLGCVVHNRNLWWVIAPDREGKPELTHLLFELWECVMGWTVRIAETVGREWPTFAASSVGIEIKMPNLSNWRSYSTPPVIAEPEDLSVSSDASSAHISMTIPEGFIQKFTKPKNIAEQEIVASLLKAVAKLADCQFSDERCSMLTREIIGSEDARFFHSVITHSIEQFFAGVGQPKPLFVRDEDSAFSFQGIADLVGRPENTDEIVGRSACLQFMEKVVEKIWERIETRLQRFDRISVNLHCFKAFDEIERDEELWNITTRSQLAVHSDKENVHEVLQGRRSERAKASICNRLIIETAQYACRHEEGLSFTEADHLTVLADMALLIILADNRDAISGGFIEPKIKIVPNGELDIDAKFSEEVLGRYFTKRSRDASDRAAADYESHFPDAEEAADDEVDKIEKAVDDFDKVFIPEFGFSLRLLFKIRDGFREVAIATKIPGGLLDEETMLNLLTHFGMTDREAELFLSRFTLPMRTSWDKDLPEGCRKHDVYPWRHRRQLSLLSRPIVQTGTTPRTWLVSVPVLQKHIAFWIGGLENAYFPKEFFRSHEMRSFIGDVTNKRGHEFAEKVGKVFSDNAYVTRLELELTALGAADKLRLGDLDVLAWDLTGRVYAVECKRLLTANSVRQVVQRLEDFKGSKEKDSLGRHLRRIEWLKENLNLVAKFTGLPVAKIQLISILITSEIVPMQFYEEMKFPTSQVISYDDLDERLRRDRA